MYKECCTCKHSYANNGGHSCDLIGACFDSNQWEPVETKEPEDTNHYDGHYQGTIQPIEVMQEHMTPEEFIGFLKGNIIKYTCRMGKKDSPDKEATKIHRYAEWLEKAAKGEKIDPRI